MKRSTGAFGAGLDLICPGGAGHCLYMPAAPEEGSPETVRTECDVTPLPDSGQCAACSAPGSMKGPSAHRRHDAAQWGSSFQTVAREPRTKLDINRLLNCSIKYKNPPFTSS